MKSAAPFTAAERLRHAGLVLLLAYPVLLLAALWWRHSWLSALAALDLISLLLLGGLLRGSMLAWAVWSLAILSGGLLAWHDQADIALMLVPVGINAAMAAFFGNTLQSGRRPLVARVILAIEGEARLQQSGVAAYARQLTWAWTILLSTQAGLMFVAALCATPGGILQRLALPSPWALPQSWAHWYGHLGGFLVIGGFSVLEFAWRRWRLRHVPHPNARTFFALIMRNWRRVLHDDPRASDPPPP